MEPSRETVGAFDIRSALLDLNPQFPAESQWQSYFSATHTFATTIGAFEQLTVDQALTTINPVTAFRAPLEQFLGNWGSLQTSSASWALGEVEREFRTLARTWKNNRRAVSSPSALAMDAAYQRIIGMGRPVVPLILRELAHEPDHWFWALKAITGDDPVPERDRGRLDRMTEAWLAWGKLRGYFG